MSELICIKCPMGCRMQIDKNEAQWDVAGNTCPKGREYAIEEMTCPRRIVTCLVKVEGAEQPLSVKTDGAVPKERIFACIQEIKRLKLKSPVQIGQVLISNVAGSGVCVRATKTV